MDAVGIVSEYRYDGERNLVEARDSNRHVLFRYGGSHKLLVREEAGTRQAFEYDTEERLIAVVNEAGTRFTYVIDACGKVESETGFDGHTRMYLRDASGRLTKTILPSGRSAEYAYDAAGCMAKIKYSDGTSASFSYDAAARLLDAKNDDSHVLFERDSIGRVLKESQDGGKTWIRSEFGPMGTRRSLLSDLGAAQTIEVGALRDLRALVHGAGAGASTIRFETDAAGLEVAIEFMGGVRVEWKRDANGRPIERVTTRRSATGLGHSSPHSPTSNAFELSGTRTAALDARSYQWRGRDQIAALVDAASGPTFFDHDARGHLVRERHPVDGRVTDRAIDATGNVYRRPDGTDRIFDASGHLLSDNEIRYEYDVDGNRTKKVESDGSEWHYRWDGAGMLSEVERPDGRRVRFAYDALARRTKKATILVGEGESESVERETQFVWDGHKVLHEVDSEKGTTTWYWKPDAFAPVMKEHDGRRWSIATDNIGTPTEMYDELGLLAWKMQLDAFGVPTFDTGSADDCPWRWPGQCEDGETGFYYNRYRHYDPRSGAYTSDDPLGLEAGLAQSAYVGDPLFWIDPFGLDVRSGSGRDHVTYRGMRNGQYYTGYASAPSGLNLSRDEIISRRYNGDFSNFGDVPPVAVYMGSGKSGKATARGLEQHFFLVDVKAHGRDNVSNAQNPVGPNNGNRKKYEEAAKRHLEGCGG